MGRYYYRVMDGEGRITTGHWQGESMASVAEELRKRGYFITSLKDCEDYSGLKQFQIGLKPSLRDMAVLSRQMAVIISAGLPMVKGLKLVIAQTPNKVLREGLVKAVSELEKGSSLWEGLAQEGPLFSPLFISMIRTGELSGKLDLACEQLAECYENDYEIQEKLKASLRYPLVVLVMALLLMVFLVTFILPSFATMFQSLGIPLPWLTRGILFTGHILKKYYLLTLPIPFLLLWMGRRYSHKDQSRLFGERILLRTPLLGDFYLKLITARVCRTLALLAKGGMNIIEAMEEGGRAANSRLVEGALSEAKERVNGGSSLAKALEMGGIIPELACQMVAVGEETGCLETMLSKAADYYEREVKQLNQVLVSAIEPILVSFLALIVGGMVVGLMLPMAQMYQMIGR